MKKKFFVLSLPFIIFAFLFMLSKLYLNAITAVHFHCPFRVFWNIYCPGCGCTRALSCLLKLDIVSSLHNNPSIIIMCVFLALGYLKLLFSVFGINKKVIPESKMFYLVLSGILIVFFVIRNFVPVLQPY